ncbi:response regulator transcription factor [Glycocaulis profundi]|nr:response regulator transcription factor [Glycocaulis profundi]
MGSQADHLLIVDDDAEIRSALTTYLSDHGYRVSVARDAPSMDLALSKEPVDAVILDVMMPGEDGFSICRRLAETGPPILVLSALNESADRIVGLELGASDYLSKPFNPRELLARVRALLRRVPTRAESVRRRAQFAGWTLEIEERRLLDPLGGAVALPASQMDLLVVFVERSGRLLTRQQLLDLTKGGGSQVFDRSVDVVISRLRRRLEGQAGEPLIETVRGEGYRFLPRVKMF